MRVQSLGSMLPAQLSAWQETFERVGARIQQSPAYAHAAAGDVIVVTGAGVIATFVAGARMCTAIGGDEPLLGATDPAVLATVMTAVLRVTGRPVYVPLVDERYAEVGEHDGFDSWRRPPNSLIDWTDQGRGLRERVRARGNSQLEVKRRMIERDGLVLDFSTTWEGAARDVLDVDDQSWKADRGQSMRQRGQAALYFSLLREGNVGAAFLRHQGKPVAFRIDAWTNDRLTCLKWSYDEAYRRYSPGLYLLTEGLTEQWGGVGLSVVDLCGGPDLLKDLLHTHRVPRVDVWCGSLEQGQRLARDRQALDARVRMAVSTGSGLRHAFA